MKKSEVKAVGLALKTLLAWDLKSLFAKAQVEKNPDLEIVKEAFEIEDEKQLERLLLSMKSASNDLTLDKDDVTTICEIFGIEEGESAALLNSIQSITSSQAPTVEDTGYIIGSAVEDFDIEDDDEEEKDVVEVTTVEELEAIETPAETKIEVSNPEVIAALIKNTTYKGITLKNSEVNSDIKLSALEEILIEGMTIKGEKGASNAKLLIDAPSIEIKGANIPEGSTNYNIFEGVQNKGFDKIKALDIECLDPQLKHNVLSFYTPNDGAQIVIKNSKFSLNPETSNVLRMSNMLNAKNVEIVFENIDWTYEGVNTTNFDWAGLMIYQPAGADVSLQGDVSNLETWTIKFNNCTYNGEPINGNNSGEHSQVLYTYNIGGHNEMVNNVEEMPFKVLFNGK